MAGKRIAGVAYLKYADRNGTTGQLALRGGWTVSIDRFEREGIAGQDDVHGYKEMPRVPFAEGDVSLEREMSIEDLQEICDATVTIELANGNAYLLRNAWTASARELDTVEGKTSIRFEGLSGEELLAA